MTPTRLSTAVSRRDCKQQRLRRKAQPSVFNRTDPMVGHSLLALRQPGWSAGVTNTSTAHTTTTRGFSRGICAHANAHMAPRSHSRVTVGTKGDFPSPLLPTREPRVPPGVFSLDLEEPTVAPPHRVATPEKPFQDAKGRAAPSNRAADHLPTARTAQVATCAKSSLTAPFALFNWQKGSSRRVHELEGIVRSYLVLIIMAVVSP